jgi:hypothetical protein
MKGPLIERLFRCIQDHEPMYFLRVPYSEKRFRRFIV